MACKSCTETNYPTAFYGPLPPCVTPEGCGDCPKGVVDTACVLYSGPQLINIGAVTNTCVETILQKIDAQLAVTTGNYSGYNVYCLAPVTTQQQFVEKISEYVCQTRLDFNTFVSTTFVTEIQDLQDQIDAFEVPGLNSCTKVGIITTDTNEQVLTKLATATCDIYSQINLSTAAWNSCFTVVGTPPTTPLEATNALISQICSIKSSQTSTVLPIFDNTSTCLTGGTATDSLITTMGLIKNRLCLSPTLNINTLTFGCTSKPSNNALDLQGTLQAILNSLDTLTKNSYTFDLTQFTVTQVSPGNLCLGKNVSLIAPGSGSSTDRLVATTSTDTTPGTLIDKVVEGTGINLDFITTPGQMIIGIDPAYQPVDDKVKVNASDPTTGYLEDKIEALGQVSTGLTLGVTTNGTNDKVVVQGSINLDALATALLEAIADDETLRTLFCNLVSSCPDPCAVPSGVTVTVT